MKKLFLVILMVCGVSVGAHAFLHEDFKSEENIKKLIGLYKEFLDKKIKSELCFAYQDFIKETKENLRHLEAVIPSLDIELPIEEIEKRYKKYGIIQLRKIKSDSKILLIGCGNCPDGNLCVSNCNEKYYKNGPEKQEQHGHEGMITIDLELSMNPTIVAVFGIDRLSFLHDNYFDKIIDETCSGDLQGTEYGIFELKRLLAKGGTFYFDSLAGIVEVSMDELIRDVKQRENDTYDPNEFDSYLKKRAQKRAKRLFLSMAQNCEDDLKKWFEKHLKKTNWVSVSNLPAPSKDDIYNLGYTISGPHESIKNLEEKMYENSKQGKKKLVIGDATVTWEENYSKFMLTQKKNWKETFGEIKQKVAKKQGLTDAESNIVNQIALSLGFF